VKLSDGAIVVLSSISAILVLWLVAELHAWQDRRRRR
jgi:hypothetical protein